MSKQFDNILNSLSWLSPTEIDRVVLCALDLSAETGNQKSRYAASVLRAAQSAGRKSIDDAEALRRIDDLVAAGKPRSSVVSIVAAQMTPDKQQRHAIAQRLRRKIKKNA